MSEEIIACPYCGDPPRHNHLHLNYEKQVFYCQYCGEGGKFIRLASDFPQLGARLMLFAGAKMPVGSRRKKKMQVYSYYPAHVDPPGVLASEVMRYLLSRGLTLDEIQEYDVQVSPQLPWYAIFPDHKGMDVFWAARSIGTAGRPWLFPHNGVTSLWRSSALWGLNYQKRESEIWIVEGIFDAIAVGGVAIYGKRITPAQLKRIFRLHPTKLFIGFDKNALKEARELQRQTRGIVPTRIETAPSSVEDYGELLKSGWRKHGR